MTLDLFVAVAASVSLITNAVVCLWVWDMRAQLSDIADVQQAMLTRPQEPQRFKVPDPGKPIKPARPQLSLVLMDANEATVHAELPCDASMRPRVLMHDGTRYVSSRSDGSRHFYRAES